MNNMNLSIFQSKNLFEAGTEFFSQIGIALNSNTSVSLDAKEILRDRFKDTDIFNNIRKTYFLGLVDDSAFDKNISLLDKDKITYEEAASKIDLEYNGIMVFGVKLSDNYLPKRGEIAELTRAFNRMSKNIPVVLLLQYGSQLSLAASERTRYQQKWREGEKIGKISLLKDINLTSPHAGHLKILYDLKLKPGIVTFNVMYKQWREVFNVQLLNKRFYTELANWYFWAVKQVKFPDNCEKDDEDVRNAASVIRLITRLIFIWFVKEKGLIPDDLFNQDRLKRDIKFTDRNNSTYYKAILQNLFFATLNTEMNKDKPGIRKFRHKAKKTGGRDQHYMIHNIFRYEDYFINPQDTLERYFENIPFLNGGLFECLDREVVIEDIKQTIRIDGFSDRKDNVLTVPDKLFFSPEQTIDLNETYGTKNKRYKVRGLIEILNSYKFTITENTPVEEEIALDPELLGKVFENLLASYNPETKTTARKQTGSYYTPREIVHYMVDESLIAYLNNHLNSTEDSEDKLRDLFDYSEEPHQFSDAEVDILIDAIDSVKILDPACGSGAFPMGILHKLVYILGKLDPDNQKWRQKQINKVLEIPDSTVREKLLEDIEQSFQSNELDYGRKLYLIENSIYGVDIQPIAVQIAKLRFFISLIVDQKVNTKEVNLGIRPLPNLETKFAAANTLIGIEKPEQITLSNPAIDEKEKELKEIRKRHLTARTQQTKKKYRKEDERLRAEIAEMLKKDGMPHETTEKLAHWNPYDQNASADFFDPEWMFGVRDGFDVVIGNPPYGNIINSKLKMLVKREYNFSNLSDISSPFIEKSINILKDSGSLVFIITFAITFNKKFSKNRRLIANTFQKNYMYSFDRDRCKTFESMTQSVSIIKCFYKNKKHKQGIFTGKFFRETPEINNIEASNADKYLLPIGTKYQYTHRLPKIGESINKQILEKLIDFDNKAEEVINKGNNYIWIRTSGNYWYNAFDRKPYTSSEIKMLSVDKTYEDFIILLMNSSLLYFWFRIYGDGRHMNTDILENFPIPCEKNILKYKNLLHEVRKSFMQALFSVFDKERNRFITSNIKPQIDLIDLILGKYLYKLKYEEMTHIIAYDLEIRGGNKLAIPFIHLVNQILTAKQKDPQADTTALERQIDIMVYRLYGLTYEEVKIVDPEFDMTEEEYNKTEKFTA